ncbi:hypothetical protein SAMN02800692_2050 [Luteibacter sp. UNC138MFCol5.1]|uniref:sel1 repeat family protein n=1 Tax=Luteibacter sp. UNC138MFCol5.1 TaxID=1502774 RepID=UPI0008D0816B|nr:sel1 repeat family protein [Luteibacter sp. UNC138MFCol5.1]SEO77249.1 hypothetical protein SAMN02800692_2050 [Luteibacter sp. UNC138MFCol5.1]
MNDSDVAWSALDALDRANDLEGALALETSSGLGDDPRYARYIGWAFIERQDFHSAGRWYARAFDLGATEAEAEFQTCLRELYLSGRKHEATQLAAVSPMAEREGTHRTMLALQFGDDDRAGMLASSLWLARRGQPADVRYAGELLLAGGDAHRALGFIRQASQDGDRLAAQWLGEMYFRGIGTAVDRELAESAYRLAAKGGFILSQSRLAHMEHQREGRRIDVRFYGKMAGILLRTLWLRLIRPQDVRLDSLPR